MKLETAIMDRAGRIVIPSAFRKELGLETGQEVLLRMEDGELRVFTRSQAIERAQGYFARFKKPGQSAVEELLEDRRREAEAEVGQ